MWISRVSQRDDGSRIFWSDTEGPREPWLEFKSPRAPSTDVEDFRVPDTDSEVLQTSLVVDKDSDVSGIRVEV